MANIFNVEAINSQILVIVANVKKGTFAQIKYECEEKVPKYLGLGQVTKIVEGNIQLNYSYQNAVNGRIEKQGGKAEFISEALPWGEWFIPNVLIVHKGEFYLRFYPHENGGLKSTYYVDGRLATAEEVDVIRAYKATKSTYSTKQANCGLTAKQVKPKNPKVVNIIYLKVGGQTYERKAYEVASTATD